MTAKKVVGRKPRQFSPIPPPPKVTVSQAPPPTPSAAEQTMAWLKRNRDALAVGALAVIVLAFVAGLLT